jgi:hypothetical protein
MSPVPPPKLASRAEVTKCSEPSRVLRLNVDLTVALFSLFVIFPGYRNECSSDGIADAEYFAIVTPGSPAGNADIAEHQCDASRSAPRA